MKFRRLLLRAAALLGVLLVVTAQCFGVGRAFLCECAGAVVVTQADHCHNAVPCSGDKDACGTDGRQGHAVAKEALRSVASGPIAAPEMIPVVIALLPQSDRHMRDVCAAEARVARLDAPRPPPAGVTVKAVQLLI